MGRGGGFCPRRYRGWVALYGWNWAATSRRKRGHNGWFETSTIAMKLKTENIPKPERLGMYKTIDSRENGFGEPSARPLFHVSAVSTELVSSAQGEQVYRNARDPQPPSFAGTPRRIGARRLPSLSPFIRFFEVLHR